MVFQDMANELLGKVVHSGLTQPYRMFRYFIHVGVCDVVWGTAKWSSRNDSRMGEQIHTRDTLIRSLKNQSFCITSENSGSHIQELCGI